ncbi:ABC transporter permease [Pasteurellaceae bacterium HPA106]|uniref:ABC-2 transporter permease n=1 Tax=Spirabiliibacterium pneumoniae TaxID=221400 RepID=UPI001AADFA03|nr:ABC transporter permease [Spirabiliibacterium pneumoniae]MBE2895435.1 ABC transporter permease [Spirabiliibacterium pneumoniae]
MLRWLKNVYFLSVKELRSLFSDYTLIGLVVIMFTFTIYSIAKGITTEVKNASVAVWDQDHSTLSYQIRDAILPPYFKQVQTISPEQIDKAMDEGEFIFVLTIPPNFEQQIMAGEQPQIQLLVDATAMTQAGVGASYLSQIINRQISEFLQQPSMSEILPLKPVVNVLFNSNLRSEWFMPMTQITGNSSLLALILVGAAVIREREHGTIEHLLVMPVSASEIAFSKILANGLVILVSAMLSLYFVVHQFLGAPINGSIALFAASEVVYLFSIAGLGLFLATQAPTMPQFSLLCLPVYIVLYLLSGAPSPFENMPQVVQDVIQLSPLTQFVAISQDVLFRGAGWETIWHRVLIMAVLGAVFVALAIFSFRSMLARQN